MTHTENVQQAVEQAIKVLTRKRINFRPMRRLGHINTERGFIIGRTNLKTKLVTIDIYTPKRRQPKKISSILRVLCHEVAHHQKPPYRQRYRGRVIVRQHYPLFYKQVNNNIAKLKRNNLLRAYFD